MNGNVGFDTFLAFQKILDTLPESSKTSFRSLDILKSLSNKYLSIFGLRNTYLAFFWTKHQGRDHELQLADLEVFCWPRTRTRSRTLKICWPRTQAWTRTRTQAWPWSQMFTVLRTRIRVFRKSLFGVIFFTHFLYYKM